MNNLQTLAQSSLWKNVQDHFAKQYQVTFLLLDKDANLLLQSGNLPYVYQLMLKKGKTEEQTRLKFCIDSLNSKGTIHVSLSGLLYLVHPLLLQNTVQGALCIAGLRDHRDLTSYFEHIAPSLSLEKEEMNDAVQTIPITEEFSLESLRKMLETLAHLFPVLAQADAQASAQIAQLTELKKMSEHFEKSLDTEDILDVLSKACIEQYHALNCVILLLDQKRRHYYVQDNLLPYEDIEHVVLPHLKKHKQILFVANLKNDFLFTHVLFGEKNASLLALPLDANANQLFFVYSKPEREWSDQEIQGISSLALRARGALEKASQFSSVQEHAMHDSLTTLLNKNFFLQHLQQTLEEGRINSQATSCMMLDLDNFKILNDTLGHQKGDEILRHISMLLQSNIRKQDVAARYGGEEFVVVLPLTQQDEARAVAERVREAIAKTPYAGISLTISIGVASSLNSSSLVSELIRAADQCLYAAKAAGKNCVKSSIIVDRSLGSIQVDTVNEMYVGK